jgi:LysR family hydrogen peroxide-inducible transcriptional activator
MTLTQLSYIVAVDVYRHFATAAEHSHVTQPTLSMQIQKLEDELGIIIFDRSRQPVVPTDIGAKVIAQARVVLQEAERVREILNEAGDRIAGDFRVGIIPTVAPYLLPLFVRSFAERYPQVRLIIEELQTQSIIHKLRNDTLDAGILATPLHAQGIMEEVLYYEPFVAYVSRSHPLFDKKELAVRDLSGRNVWLLSEGHCFREQALRICGERQETESPHVRFESGNLETLKRLVEQNDGMTLLPWLAVQELTDEHRQLVRPFSRKVPTREISIVYNRAYLKKSLIEAFAKEIHAILPRDMTARENRYIVELHGE